MGRVERMWRWNTSIPTAATLVGSPPPERNRASGMANSSTVPAWPRKTARRDGRTSWTASRCMRRLKALIRTSGLLDSIVSMTCPKWWLIFDVAAPHQMTIMVSFHDTIMSTGGKAKATMNGR